MDPKQKIVYLYRKNDSEREGSSAEAIEDENQRRETVARSEDEGPRQPEHVNHQARGQSYLLADYASREQVKTVVEAAHAFLREGSNLAGTPREDETEPTAKGEIPSSQVETLQVETLQVEQIDGNSTKVSTSEVARKTSNRAPKIYQSYSAKSPEVSSPQDQQLQNLAPHLTIPESTVISKESQNFSGYDCENCASRKRTCDRTLPSCRACTSSTACVYPNTRLVPDHTSRAENTASPTSPERGISLINYDGNKVSGKTVFTGPEKWDDLKEHVQLLHEDKGDFGDSRGALPTVNDSPRKKKPLFIVGDENDNDEDQQSSPSAPSTPSRTPVSLLTTLLKSTPTSQDDAQHNLSRPYKCPLCPRIFSRLEHQTRHTRTHARENGFTCPFLGCSKRFSTTELLTRHLRIHSNPTSRRNRTQYAAALADALAAAQMAQTIHRDSAAIDDPQISNSDQKGKIPHSQTTPGSESSSSEPKLKRVGHIDLPMTVKSDSDEDGDWESRHIPWLSKKLRDISKISEDPEENESGIESHSTRIGPSTENGEDNHVLSYHWSPGQNDIPLEFEEFLPASELSRTPHNATTTHQRSSPLPALLDEEEEEKAKRELGINSTNSSQKSENEERRRRPEVSERYGKPHPALENQQSIGEHVEESVPWNPQRVFDQWNNAFGVPTSSPNFLSRENVEKLSPEASENKAAKTSTNRSEKTESPSPYLIRPSMTSSPSRDQETAQEKASIEGITQEVKQRKDPTIYASSKADIFEQKVAAAVAEADSSDTNDTSINDSNSPDQQLLYNRSQTYSRTSIITKKDTLDFILARYAKDETHQGEASGHRTRVRRHYYQCPFLRCQIRTWNLSTFKKHIKHEHEHIPEYWLITRSKCFIDQSDEEESEREHIHQLRKKRGSADTSKTLHSQSLDVDSSCSENEVLDDHDSTAHRLRRKPPGPVDRSPPSFVDGGFGNPNHVIESEEPVERGKLRLTGPPSIPSDDAFTLDELDEFEELSSSDVEKSKQPTRQEVVYESPIIYQRAESESGSPRNNDSFGRRRTDARSHSSPPFGPVRLHEHPHASDHTKQTLFTQGIVPAFQTSKDGIKDFQTQLLALEQHNRRRLLFAQERQEIDNDTDSRNDDTDSEISSYAASVLSVESLASSATDISRGSGYSAHQIATATKELVTIFQEDPVLVPLYKRAINDSSIGPDKLQRNLRRLFKHYAELLEGEAKDRLEYLASRLVSLKARFLAQSIVQLFNGPVRPRVKTVEVNYESSEEEEEEQSSPVDDTAFEDLVIFREFLVGSEAFRTLQAQVKSFAVPRSTYTPKMPEPQTSTNKDDVSFGESAPSRTDSELTVRPTVEATLDTNAWSYVKNFIGVPLNHLNAFLVATGCFEPPLDSGKVRVRWQCGCGEGFVGDFTEHKTDGITKMLNRMQQATKATVISVTSEPEKTSPRSTGQHPGLWFRNGLTSLVGSFNKQSKQCSLPQHTPTATCSSSTPSHNGQQRPMLHLLSCMHAGRFRKTLAQDRIEKFNTDRQLFCFISKQFRTHRGRFRNLLSLKTVRGIYFTKFRLPMGGSVELRAHDPCCANPQPCECIPPPSRVEPSPSAEYRCIPGPPSVWPPIDPHYLSHLFKDPSCINENDTWILDQLPKRTAGELHGAVGKPADGWGIYYEEDWDRDIITVVVVSLFIVSSLVFGVSWSYFKMDVQGAFGVSAYLMAVCVAIMSLVAMKVDKV